MIHSQRNTCVAACQRAASSLRGVSRYECNLLPKQGRHEDHCTPAQWLEARNVTSASYRTLLLLVRVVPHGAYVRGVMAAAWQRVAQQMGQRCHGQLHDRLYVHVHGFAKNRGSSGDIMHSPD